MDGLEFYKKMRANKKFTHIPFVMVSSVSEASRVIEAIEAGVDEYVIKPIKPDDFAHRVKDVLTKK